MSAADILPPSPPTTSSRKQRMPLFQIPPTSTPDDSPASGPPSSLGSRKKVGFSPWTNILPTEIVNATETVTVRPLPPSRECSSSGKSILKSSGHVQPRCPFGDSSSDEKQPLNETMDSILQQLSRNDTVECVDAYQTLASAVKAYDELPEQLVLKGKLQAILKSIRLHLSALDQPEPQPCDVNLVTSALKVLVILVWNTDFAPFLTDDFRLFALDRAITTVAEHKAPKSVIVHYLHFLATQDFRQGLFTSARTVKLLDGLAHLTDHVKGNGVIVERLLVYHKLLDQVKPVMKVKAGLWVEHMISAMVSTIPDTRSKALGLGRKACQSFPASDSIASIVKAVLADIQDDGKTKGYTMCKKLEKMTANKDGAEQVPQVWAIMILLCSSETIRIDKWPGLKDWLMVIQRCFNSSDSNLRLQANMAWNRFVYVARPQELEASEGLLTMLVKPIVPQLERQNADKSSKASHSAAVSSYCNLLYYAFRPATSPARLTKAWNEYIVKVMRSSFFEKNAANADLACRILMTLLWNNKTGTKVWNEKRAHETRPVDPEELPTIDSKWVRSHAANIVTIFELLFRFSSWGLPESSEQAYISRTWRHFVKSVRSASSKEIKMSSETRTSVLAILDGILRTSKGEGNRHNLTDHALHNITSIATAELGSSLVLEALESDRPISFATMALSAVLDQLKLKLQTDGSPSKQHVDGMNRCFEILEKSLSLTYTIKDIEATDDDALINATVKALNAMPMQHTGSLLFKIKSGLSLWLKDEHCRLHGSSLQRLADAFALAAAKVAPATLNSLDELFAAAFSSSHGTVVGIMATLWNKYFEEVDASQIPEQLSTILLRLRCHIELQLPPSLVDEQADSGSLPAYNRQVMEIEHVASPELGGKGQAQSPQEMTESVDSIAVRPLDVAPVARKNVERPSSRHRPRHNDSQVDFVPVESSPVAANQESQYLTDHQKEVRDRQRGEPAVVFADLRSSPRPASRAPSESRSDCGIARRAATMVERPSTPVPDPADDAEIQPSPTPRSRYIRNLAEVEIPSSPPSIQGAQERVTDLEPSREAGTSNVEITGAPGDGDVDMEEEGFVEESSVEVVGEDTTYPLESHSVTEETIITGVLDEEAELAVSHAMDQASPSAARNGVETLATAAEGSIAPGEPRRDDVLEKAPDLVAAVPAAEPRLPEREKLAANNANFQQPVPPSTPQQGSSRVDSDELELMSASQLSNDLDWSVVLDGLDRTPALSVASIEKAADEQSEASQPYSQTSQGKTKTRKRKAASAGWTRSKKSKNSIHSSSRSSESAEPIIKHEEQEILDVIEVIDRSDPVTMSSSPARDTEQEIFVDAPESQQQQHAAPILEPKKRRGRPKKKRLTEARAASRSLRSSSLLSSSQSGRDRRSVYSVESSVGPEASSAAASIAVVVERTRVVSVDREGSKQTEAVEDAAPDAVGVASSPEPPTTVAATLETPTDILASLQQVLQRVKNGEAKGLDLRAIDDLCFSIRFHAQENGSRVL